MIHRVIIMLANNLIPMQAPSPLPHQPLGGRGEREPGKEVGF